MENAQQTNILYAWLKFGLSVAKRAPITKLQDNTLNVLYFDRELINGKNARGVKQTTTTKKRPTIANCVYKACSWKRYCVYLRLAHKNRHILQIRTKCANFFLLVFVQLNLLVRINWFIFLPSAFPLTFFSQSIVFSPSLDLISLLIFFVAFVFFGHIREFSTLYPKIINDSNSVNTLSKIY